jgi:hypothetical protein
MATWEMEVGEEEKEEKEEEEEEEEKEKEEKEEDNARDSSPVVWGWLKNREGLGQSVSQFNQSASQFVSCTACIQIQYYIQACLGWIFAVQMQMQIQIVVAGATSSQPTSAKVRYLLLEKALVCENPTAAPFLICSFPHPTSHVFLLHMHRYRSGCMCVLSDPLPLPLM